MNSPSQLIHNTASSSPLRIGILVCDTPNERIVREKGDYPLLLKKLLAPPSPRPLTFTSFDCLHKPYPRPDPKDFDGFLITGSKYGVYEDEEWIRALEKLIRQLDKERVPMVGICFGAQVLASALGGTVEKNKAGWEAGVVSFELSDFAKQYFATEKTSLSLQYIHQDHVLVVPPGARSFGGTAVCPVEGFAKEDYIFALQGHPEFDGRVLELLLESKEEAVPAELVEASKKTLQQPTDSNWIAQFILSFFTRIAPVIRS